jgi:hypothetical protein
MKGGFELRNARLALGWAKGNRNRRYPESQLFQMSLISGGRSADAGRSYFFAAASAAERDSWCIAIDNALMSLARGDTLSMRQGMPPAPPAPMPPQPQPQMQQQMPPQMPPPQQQQLPPQRPQTVKGAGFAGAVNSLRQRMNAKDGAGASAEAGLRAPAPSLALPPSASSASAATASSAGGIGLLASAARLAGASGATPRARLMRDQASDRDSASRALSVLDNDRGDRTSIASTASLGRNRGVVGNGVQLPPLVPVFSTAGALSQVQKEVGQQLYQQQARAEQRRRVQQAAWQAGLPVPAQGSMAVDSLAGADLQQQQPMGPDVVYDEGGVALALLEPSGQVLAISPEGVPVPVQEAAMQLDDGSEAAVFVDDAGNVYDPSGVQEYYSDSNGNLYHPGEARVAMDATGQEMMVAPAPTNAMSLQMPVEKQHPDGALEAGTAVAVPDAITVPGDMGPAVNTAGMIVGWDQNGQPVYEQELVAMQQEEEAWQQEQQQQELALLQQQQQQLFFQQQQQQQQQQAVAAHSASIADAQRQKLQAMRDALTRARGSNIALPLPPPVMQAAPMAYEPAPGAVFVDGGGYFVGAPQYMAPGPASVSQSQSVDPRLRSFPAPTPRPAPNPAGPAFPTGIKPGQLHAVRRGSGQGQTLRGGALSGVFSGRDGEMTAATLGATMQAPLTADPMAPMQPRGLLAPGNDSASVTDTIADVFVDSLADDMDRGVGNKAIPASMTSHFYATQARMASTGSPMLATAPASPGVPARREKTQVVDWSGPMMPAATSDADVSQNPYGFMSPSFTSGRHLGMLPAQGSLGATSRRVEMGAGLPTPLRNPPASSTDPRATNQYLVDEAEAGKSAEQVKAAEHGAHPAPVASTLSPAAAAAQVFAAPIGSVPSFWPQHEQAKRSSPGSKAADFAPLPAPPAVPAKSYWPAPADSSAPAWRENGSASFSATILVLGGGASSPGPSRALSRLSPTSSRVLSPSRRNQTSQVTSASAAFHGKPYTLVSRVDKMASLTLGKARRSIARQLMAQGCPDAQDRLIFAVPRSSLPVPVQSTFNSIPSPVVTSLVAMAANGLPAGSLPAHVTAPEAPEEWLLVGKAEDAWALSLAYPTLSPGSNSAISYPEPHIFAALLPTGMTRETAVVGVRGSTSPNMMALSSTGIPLPPRPSQRLHPSNTAAGRSRGFSGAPYDFTGDFLRDMSAADDSGSPYAGDEYEETTSIPAATLAAIQSSPVSKPAFPAPAAPTSSVASSSRVSNPPSPQAPSPHAEASAPTDGAVSASASARGLVSPAVTFSNPDLRADGADRTATRSRAPTGMSMDVSMADSAAPVPSTASNGPAPKGGAPYVPGRHVLVMTVDIPAPDARGPEDVFTGELRVSVGDDPESVAAAFLGRNGALPFVPGRPGEIDEDSVVFRTFVPPLAEEIRRCLMRVYALELADATSAVSSTTQKAADAEMQLDRLRSTVLGTSSASSLLSTSLRSADPVLQRSLVDDALTVAEKVKGDLDQMAARLRVSEAEAEAANARASAAEQAVEQIQGTTRDAHASAVTLRAENAALRESIGLPLGTTAAAPVSPKPFDRAQALRDAKTQFEENRRKALWNHFVDGETPDAAAVEPNVATDSLTSSRGPSSSRAGSESSSAISSALPSYIQPRRRAPPVPSLGSLANATAITQAAAAAVAASSIQSSVASASSPAVHTHVESSFTQRRPILSRLELELEHLRTQWKQDMGNLGLPLK